MIAPVLSVLSKVGLWAAAVKGAHVGAQVAGNLAQEYLPSSATPIVAGFGDAVTFALDPLDVLGERKARRAGKTSTGAAPAPATVSAATAAKSKQLKANIAKAEEQAKTYARKSRNAKEAGRASEAEFLAKQSQSARRWAKAAQSVASHSSGKDPREALAILQAANELARTGARPPMNAPEAINAQTSESGKAIAASLVDAINRAQEPDYNKLASKLVVNGPDLDLLLSAAETDDANASVAGPCCMSCNYGGSCASKKKVEPSMINGSFDPDDEEEGGFRSFFEALDEADGEDDGDDDFAEALVRGDDDTGESFADAIFEVAGPAIRESELEEQSDSEPDGLSYIDFTRGV